MDTSNSPLSPIDFIIERTTTPIVLTRDDYADLFDAVCEFVAPLLSSLGMSPLDQIKGRQGGWGLPDVVGIELEGSRLALVYQTSPSNIRRFNGGLFGAYEVYLTEQGHWLSVMSWREDANGIRIIRNREDFLKYYDAVENDDVGLHPSHWLLRGPQNIVRRAVNKARKRLSHLELVDQKLGDWARRYDMVESSID